MSRHPAWRILQVDLDWAILPQLLVTAAGDSWRRGSPALASTAELPLLAPACIRAHLWGLRAHVASAP